MKEKTSALLKFSGLLLFFGLCMIMLCRGVKAQAAGDMKLNVSEVSIAKDGSFRLRAYNISPRAKIIFRSSAPMIAYVDQRGYITGISNGECVVTATVVEGGTPTATLQCKVLIGPAAISVKLTKTELVLSTGMKKTLKTIVSPLNTVEKPVFYSSDKTIASVTSIGRVKAKQTGEATIFAFLENGQSAECRVYVLEEEDYLVYAESGTLEGIISDYTPEDDSTDTADSQKTEDDTDDREDADDDANQAEPTAILKAN